MNEDDWRLFLTDYSRELLANTRIRDRLPPEVAESGWLGYPPATEEEIVAAEGRLGVRLPPSYRAFLGVSNGWRNANAFINDIWSCKDIAWFRERNQEWIDAYLEPAKTNGGSLLSRVSRVASGERHAPLGGFHKKSVLFNQVAAKPIKEEPSPRLMQNARRAHSSVITPYPSTLPNP